MFQIELNRDLKEEPELKYMFCFFIGTGNAMILNNPESAEYTQM